MITVLVDTCVIIDVLQKREPFWEDSAEIFRAVADEKITGVITAKSLTDIYYIHHRFSHNDNDTRAVLLKLLSLFSCADTTTDDCINALHSDISDFEDAVMVETAKRLRAEYIVSRNIRDYKKSPIKTISPHDLRLMLQES